MRHSKKHDPRGKTTPMSKAKFLKLIKDEDVEYVDVRFTDPRGN